MRYLFSLVLLPVLLAADAPQNNGAATPPYTPVQGKPGTPISLFNAKDLTGWSWHASNPAVKAEDVWTVKEGLLHSVSKPRSTGFLDTDKSYKNFILTVEYRHLTRDNGGIFICINDEEKVWPNALQVQAKFGAVGDLINQNSGLKKVTSDPARTKTVNKDIIVSRMSPPVSVVPPYEPEKPLGEWNTLVITMENGHLSVANNNLLLNTAADITPDAGKIGLQAEGAEMEFRKIELTPIN